MTRIELDDNARQVLMVTLQRVVSDLGMEIAGTERLEFRNMLKNERDQLQKILDQLQKADRKVA